MNEIDKRLAARLERLANPLAAILVLHLFVEKLLDRVIEARSRTPTRILDDHRAYSWAVKLTIVHNMGLLDDTLFKNLVALNSLRNKYAHELDTTLEDALFPRGGTERIVFLKRDSSEAFIPADVRAQLENDPDASLSVLATVRDLTFDWLHGTCEHYRVPVPYDRKRAR